MTRITSSIILEPPNRRDLAYENNNKYQSCKTNSIDCNKTKHIMDADESTARTEDETDDDSLRLGPGFGSLYLTSNSSSLSDTATYNSSPSDPTRVRSSSGLTSIDEVVEKVVADREVWRRKSLLADNDDDQYDDYPSDEEGIKMSFANKISSESTADDVGRDTYKHPYPAGFHCSTKLEANSSFEEPLSCREKLDQPALGCDENLCSPGRRNEYEQTSGEPENEWVGLIAAGFYNLICGTPYRR